MYILNPYQDSPTIIDSDHSNEWFIHPYHHKYDSVVRELEDIKDAYTRDVVKKDVNKWITKMEQFYYLHRNQVPPKEAHAFIYSYLHFYAEFSHKFNVVGS